MWHNAPAYSEVANLGGLAAGAHEVGTLDDLLEKFTKKYVQCFSCGNPETRVRIKKGNIFLKCKVWASCPSCAAPFHSVASCCIHQLSVV